MQMAHILESVEWVCVESDLTALYEYIMNLPTSSFKNHRDFIKGEVSVTTEDN